MVMDLRSLSLEDVLVVDQLREGDMFVIVSLLDEEEDCCLVFRFTSLIHSSPLRAFLETPVVEKRQEEVHRNVELLLV
jgi:hypothetical protein